MVSNLLFVGVEVAIRGTILIIGLHQKDKTKMLVSWIIYQMCDSYVHYKSKYNDEEYFDRQFC